MIVLSAEQLKCHQQTCGREKRSRGGRRGDTRTAGFLPMTAFRFLDYLRHCLLGFPTLAPSAQRGALPSSDRPGDAWCADDNSRARCIPGTVREVRNIEMNHVMDSHVEEQQLERAWCKSLPLLWTDSVAFTAENPR